MKGRVGLGLAFLGLYLLFHDAQAKPWKGAAVNVDPFPCLPESEFLSSNLGQPSPAFCSEWDPDFPARGYRYCARPTDVPSKTKGKRRRRRSRMCPSGRVKINYCDELSVAQREFSDRVRSGKAGDILDLIAREAAVRGADQAHCGPSDGFLALGRRVIPTTANRLIVKGASRCVDFGTDAMALMLEWLGRQVAAEYSEPQFEPVRLLIGDISAPRGGCLTGQSGRRGHSSHTSGQDVDIGFFTLRAKSAGSSDVFSREFDPKANWWLIRKIFQNPYACVKAVFLDKRLIRKLNKALRNELEWEVLRPHVRHVRGHRHHLHVRIGDGPGAPGCKSGPGSDEELEEEIEDLSQEEEGM